ncbi:MAG: hypothetical protein V3T88_05550, partial [Nitrosomonadaceae bacterium]
NVSPNLETAREVQENFEDEDSVEIPIPNHQNVAPRQAPVHPIRFNFTGQPDPGLPVLQNGYESESTDSDNDNDEADPVPPIAAENLNSKPMENYQNDEEDADDFANGWEWLVRDTGASTSEFEGVPGCTTDPTQNSPQDFFRALMSDRIYSILADETNAYARKRREGEQFISIYLPSFSCDNTLRYFATWFHPNNVLSTEHQFMKR